MKHLVSMTIVGLLLSGTFVNADQHGKSKKHGNDKHGVSRKDVDSRSTVVHVVWTSRDVEIIRTHYGSRYRSLPPGLRKKYARTGQLPPGWQKKMEPFPVFLERECAPLPPGHRRGVIDGHAVIYNSTGQIIDVAVLF